MSFLGLFKTHFSFAWIEAFGQCLGSTLYSGGGKKETVLFLFLFFCLPAGIMRTSNGRNLPLFLLVDIGHVEVWKEKLGAWGRAWGLSTLMFDARGTNTQNISDAFQSEYNCTLCWNHKALCGAANRDTEENLTLEIQKTQNKRQDCVSEWSALLVPFPLFKKALPGKPGLCLSGKA